MTSASVQPNAWTLEEIALHFGPVELQQPLTRGQFLALADHYPDLAMERESNGITTIMTPVKKGSSKRESLLHGLLFIWNFQAGQGEVHGPNGTYDLPDGATKMPDVSWIASERLKDEPDDDDSFIKVVPDFVAEIRSGTDRLSKLRSKMTDTWMANGVRLAWLIDPYEEKAYVYRQGQEVEVIAGFSDKQLSGESVLPGFELPLAQFKVGKE